MESEDEDSFVFVTGASEWEEESAGDEWFVVMAPEGHHHPVHPSPSPPAAAPQQNPTRNTSGDDRNNNNNSNGEEEELPSPHLIKLPTHSPRPCASLSVPAGTLINWDHDSRNELEEEELLISLPRSPLSLSPSPSSATFSALPIAVNSVPPSSPLSSITTTTSPYSFCRSSSVSTSTWSLFESNNNTTPYEDSAATTRTSTQDSAERQRHHEATDSFQQPSTPGKQEEEEQQQDSSAYLSGVSEFLYPTDDEEEEEEGDVDERTLGCSSIPPDAVRWRDFVDIRVTEHGCGLNSKYDMLGNRMRRRHQRKMCGRYYSWNISRNAMDFFSG